MSANRALTLTEMMIGMVILGIALFITLPRLSQSKTSGEQAAAIAKAIMLNQAKDAYISLNGINPANAAWQAQATDQLRYDLIRQLIPNNTATLLNAGANVTTLSPAIFRVPGYLFDFDDTLITSPVLLYKDINANNTIETATDIRVHYQ